MSSTTIANVREGNVGGLAGPGAEPSIGRQRRDGGGREELLRPRRAQELLDSLREMRPAKLDDGLEDLLRGGDDQAQDQVHEDEADRDVDDGGPEHGASSRAGSSRLPLLIE
jgi:hypothetical protein